MNQILPYFKLSVIFFSQIKLSYVKNENIIYLFLKYNINCNSEKSQCQTRLKHGNNTLEHHSSELGAEMKLFI